MPTLEQDNPWKLLYTLSHLLLVWTLAMLPSLILNAPVRSGASAIISCTYLYIPCREPCLA